MSDPDEDTIRRRMRNTGESYSEAKKNVAAARRMVAAAEVPAEPGWEEKWKADPSPATRAEVLGFLRSMSPAILELVKKFPPLCLVRAVVTLHVPAPGSVGIVHSYKEKVGGGLLVSVLQHPRGSILADCAPEDLELAGCKEGMSAETIATLVRELSS